MYTCYTSTYYEIYHYMFFIRWNIFYIYFYILCFIFSFFSTKFSTKFSFFTFPNIVFFVLKNLCHYFLYNAFEIIISKDRKVAACLLWTVNKVDLIHFAYTIYEELKKFED